MVNLPQLSAPLAKLILGLSLVRLAPDSDNKIQVGAFLTGKDAGCKIVSKLMLITSCRLLMFPHIFSVVLLMDGLLAVFLGPGRTFMEDALVDYDWPPQAHEKPI